MKRTLSIILVGFISTILALQTQAQHVQKIGTANLEYILSNLPETKKVESDLKAYEEQLQTQLTAKQAEFERKYGEYQNGVKSGVMPTAVLADKEKELATLQQSIQEFERSATQDLESKYYSMMEPINTKVTASIEKVAAANDYTYIISTHTDYAGTPIVLYSKNKEANDISKLVLKDLGVTVPATPATGTTGTGTTGTTNTTSPTNTTNPAIPAKK
jgi:outer membrane protein